MPNAALAPAVVTCALGASYYYLRCFHLRWCQRFFLFSYLLPSFFPAYSSGGAYDCALQNDRFDACQDAGLSALLGTASLPTLPSPPVFVHLHILVAVYNYLYSKKSALIHYCPPPLLLKYTRFPLLSLHTITARCEEPADKSPRIGRVLRCVKRHFESLESIR